MPPIRRLHPAPAQSQATEIEARAEVAACDQQLARYREALTTAMRAVFAELRAQVLRPPSGEFLDAVEYVVECWDHLARVLSQDWRTYDNESGEIGSELAALHLDLCEQLRNDPLELAERLATLAAACEADCCLNPQAPYRHLLGPDGFAVFEERWKVLRRW